jgi:hypothetical protein
MWKRGDVDDDADDDDEVRTGVPQNHVTATLGTKVFFRYSSSRFSI